MTNGDPGTPGPQETTSGPQKIHLGDPRVPLYFGLYCKNMHCRCKIFISFLLDRSYFEYLVCSFSHYFKTYRNWTILTMKNVLNPVYDSWTVVDFLIPWNLLGSPENLVGSPDFQTRGPGGPCRKKLVICPDLCVDDSPMGATLIG